MDTNFLSSEAKKLVALPKGILAIDESVGTCHGRFEKLGVEKTEENRRKYRQMLITTPGIEEYISGFILVPETVVQATSEGVLFADILRQKGISIGVTSNTGYELFNEVNEVKQEVTVGLSDLATRMPEYKKLGASFSKWREQVRIGNGVPTDEFLQEGAKRLAQYANICQANNVVPIVEPEILVDGDHTIEKCYEVTAHNLGILFAELKAQNVYIPGILLKPSMVLSGNTCPVQANTEQVAEMTVKCLKENVPSDIGGIVFLSGGQTEAQACENLRTMHQMYPELPWSLSFSYGRAIQYPALKAWAANMEDVSTAQKLLVENARNNANANLGK
jgi:fructose-bisphosphate aldolase class I